MQALPIALEQRDLIGVAETGLEDFNLCILCHVQVRENGRLCITNVKLCEVSSTAHR